MHTSSVRNMSTFRKFWGIASKLELFDGRVIYKYERSTISKVKSKEKKLYWNVVKTYPNCSFKTKNFVIRAQWPKQGWYQCHIFDFWTEPNQKTFASFIDSILFSGASLDRRSGKLIESKPKVLYEQMSVIYIFAINTTAGKDPKLYECPIYRKPQRTDQKYVGSIDFETDYNPRHWTLRGVALLCDIK